MSLSRFGRPAILAVASAVLLSACAGTSPGVAAKVGDDEISLAQVNSAADAVCRSAEGQLESEGQAVPLNQVRQLSVSLLADASRARQLADEYGVRPGPEVQRERAQWQQQADATLPEELRDHYVEVATAQTYVSSVISQVGEQALIADGVAEPSGEEASQRGSDIFFAWADDHEVEVDPRFGMQLVDGRFQPGETALSVPVSDLAKAAGDETNTEYPQGLPGSQRCG